HVFSSGDDFYFLNCASAEASVVTSPKGKERLWKQMDEDIKQVQVELLPDW
ncbi:hypothetical protein DFH29DRAFT_804063, partial [Suillus ampliporus]